MSLVCRSCSFFQVVACCVQRQVPSTTAVHEQGRHLPFRGADSYPHDQAVQQTIEIPLLPYTRWLMSLFTGRADFPCRGAEVDSHGPLLSDQRGRVGDTSLTRSQNHHHHHQAPSCSRVITSLWLPSFPGPSGWPRC